MSQLLRIATAGSVDDGKSTLIGRLLFDTKAVFEDQYEALPHRGVDHRDTPPDLALLTDGLRSEREQGITIDVAYRYFATPRRKFIIADAPGHVQYTRNMVTGASTADAALILVDARKGVLQQSRRHAFIASLLGLSHLVLCVNKMDLVDWSQQRYDAVREEFERFATKLEVDSITAVPVSALTGDNVVSRSDNLPWYTGPDLITCMEQLDTSSDGRLLEFRLPVQYVVRHQVENSRHYTGTVAAGTIRPGDEVIVLPSGAATTISQVHGPGGRALAVAGPDEAVSVRLSDDIDIGRGDMICQDVNRPHVSDEIDAMLCWLSDDTALLQEHPYILQHTTSATRAWVHDVDYRLDIDTLDQDASVAGLSVNEIGRVRIHTQHPLLFDPYRRNRRTGSFTLIDEITNNTVAAGMIIGPGRGVPQLVWHDSAVARSERPSRGMTIWLTGLPGSGKSTTAIEVERRLIQAGRPAYVLDGDNLRHGLCSNLGFSFEDRAENVRRTGEVAALLADAGVIAIVSLVSPFRGDRQRVRELHVERRLPFAEVFVDTPLDVCEERDPKGMYAMARAGELTGFTGVDDPYEEPISPELHLRHGEGSATEHAAAVLALAAATGRPTEKK